MAKPSNSYRLTEEARSIIKKLAANMGVSQAAVIEIAVRELAGRKKVA